MRPSSVHRHCIWRERTSVAIVAALSLLPSAGCSLLNDTTSPSPISSSTNTTVTFTGTLAPGSAQGSNSSNFTVSQAGTVSVTLSSLSATMGVGLGIGVPSGTTACTLTSSISTAVAGSTPQIVVTENPGAYCVSIYDVGNLTSAATFSITVVHP
jgi:hypothetical protein